MSNSKTNNPAENGVRIDEHVVGIWFVKVKDNEDWLCTVRELKPDCQYEIVYRFRYYSGVEGETPFDSTDKKHWYSIQCDRTRAFAIASVRLVAREIAKCATAEEPFELLNDGDFETFINKFVDAPFVHCKLPPKDQPNG